MARLNRLVTLYDSEPDGLTLLPKRKPVAGSSGSTIDNAGDAAKHFLVP